LTKRKARASGRPISTQHSMHFVLRSSLARGDWSFLRHKDKISEIVNENSKKFGVRIHSLANVGNHLHMHLHFTNRYTYKRFIRAISAAIMMTVTGASRWKTFAQIVREKQLSATHFWDRRPFSRIIIGFKALLNLRDYVQVNRFEQWGYSRDDARFMVRWDRDGMRFAGYS
jgi:REP element-mobilizing transposase RayT